MPSSDLLTLAEVLARYSGGPQTGVFTDGGSAPNPGPGGWGAVYVVDGEIIDQAHGHDPDTTNNRMELTALIRGCGLVPAGTPVTVYSDSNLAVQSMKSWAKGWEERGWKRKTGPVENLDLVKELYYLLGGRPELDLEWIKAHDGSVWNEYADSLANAWRRSEL
jgi:ribonuclease HI